ncbi:DMT family transporter [Maritalea sp.]|uniref:DMT family transporter n=1 Tax=Maritalea sp. TaxID=2003361 RepID=UPI003EF46D76
MNVANIWLIFASFLGGALIAAQGPIYARMSLAFDSTIAAALVAFLLATAAIGVIAIITKTSLPNLSQLNAAPKWVWLGALVGVYQVLISISAVPKLGVGPFILIVVFGQIIASQLYDQFAWFDLEQRNISIKAMAGVALMSAGLMLVVWR